MSWRIVGCCVFGFATLAEAAGPPAFRTFQPGGFRTIRQELTVNVVFVGYEAGPGPRGIREADFRAGLPAGYEALVRYPMFYGLRYPTGTAFTYRYNVVYADAAFEDAFFGYLGAIAVPKPLTSLQEAYNAQAARSRTIAANAWVDAPSVERWLAEHAGEALGVDTTSYTVFLVNWYGRPDFRHHVYTKTGEADPDTGFDFGLETDSRKLIAWGGTTPDDEESGLDDLHRIWFYDLSAGPESWTDNWDIEGADRDGDGVTDYRMPPVWEYGNPAGYRPFDDLSGDLAKVVRYVAIDLLFTTSPLCKPAVSGPRLPTNIQLDVNLFQAEPGVDGRQFVLPGLVAAELAELQPVNRFAVEVTGQPFVARAAGVYEAWVNNVPSYGNRPPGDPFANLFFYFGAQLMRFLEGDADYEVPIFAFNTTDALRAGFLGFADDNWADGTQSYVYAFDSPSDRDRGYGFTTTLIHEVGHHLAMSHPHDGYDSESGLDYGPTGPQYFAWSGDQCNSMMSYIDLNWDFSQFDRDNMARYLTAAYINEANVVLARVVRSPKVGQVAGLLAAADAQATAALDDYAAMEYPAAASRAKAAYGGVLQAAARIGVKVEPQAWPADYKAKGKSPKYIDGLEEHRFRP
jgi:hypothetical protein